MRFIKLGSPVKPCLVKWFKWLLKILKAMSWQRAYFVLGQSTKGIPKGTVPFGN